MVLAAPGSELYRYRLTLCHACPFYVEAPGGVTGAVAAVAGALTGESGKCGNCGCPTASRVATSCPLGRF